MGAAADQAARLSALAEYQSKKSANTLNRQRANLVKFARFLNSHGADIGMIAGEPESTELFTTPEAWRGVTFGLVEAFKLNLVKSGYALTSVNVYLSTIKSYSKIALKAGALSAETYTLIKSIEGYRGREATNINARRANHSVLDTKGDSILIPAKAIQRAKDRSFYKKNEVGARDHFIMCLLFDLGLRASEMVSLHVGSFDTATGTLKVYRSKTDHIDLLNMSKDIESAYGAYMAYRPDTMAHDNLIVTAKRDKNGTLTTNPMHRVSLTRLVKRVGRKLSREFGLSQLAAITAHDCRHSWATHASNAGTPTNILQVAGGWSNPLMAIEYSVAGKIKNEGIKLPY